MAHIVCLINVDPDRAATLTWSEGPASFEPYCLEGQIFDFLQDSVQELREKLASMVVEYHHHIEGLGPAAYALAETGHELYELLFSPGSGRSTHSLIASQVRNWLESLRDDDAIESLEMVVDGKFSAPWNVIYDKTPDEQAFLTKHEGGDHWKAFWGLRYNLASGKRVDPLRRKPLLRAPQVLMVIDREIREGLPDEDQKRLKDFEQRHDRVTVVDTKKSLIAAVKEARPQLIYWLSHAEPAQLILDEVVKPKDLWKMLRDEDPDAAGGLAFLNGCQTAETESGSFLDTFQSVGFSGIVGAEHQTIDTFANPFGLDFLEAFLDGGKPLGEILQRLRHRVPLGLLYGAYCPPNIRVPIEEDHEEIEVSIRAPIKGSKALGSPDPQAERRSLPLPELPYRSLAQFGAEDRALFAGRDADVERFSTLLDEASVRMLVLHGESGVGKSSFLRAGVIPFLEEECFGFQFMRDGDTSGQGSGEAIIFVRATNDLVGQLAQSLFEYCQRPYEYTNPLRKSIVADLPAALETAVGSVVDALALETKLLADRDTLGQILTAISSCLPFAAVLVVDQGEEIFTLARTSEDREKSRKALEMLRATAQTAGDFKLILSLRTEYYGRLVDGLRRGQQDQGRIREYLLTDFAQEHLVEAIRRPTADARIPLADEIPRQKYGFRYEDGVPEELAQRILRFTAQGRDSPLPLLQVVCAQLYKSIEDRPDRVITRDDLDSVGGIEGGLRNYVERLIDQEISQRASDRTALRALLTDLYHRQPDGTLTTQLLAVQDLEKKWNGTTPFSELLATAQEKLLLRVNTRRVGDDLECQYVSLGHDALASVAEYWDRGRQLRELTRKVLAASCIAVALAGLAVAAFFFKWRADVAKQAAFERLVDSRESADEWLFGVRKTLEFYPGLEGVQRDLLEKADRKFNERFDNIDRHDEKSEVARWLLRRGDANQLLGNLDRQEGELERAAEHFNAADSAYKKAHDEFERLVADSMDPELRLQLANSGLGVALVHRQDEEYEDAKRACLQSLSLIDQLLASAPSHSKYRHAKGRTQLELARVHRDQQEFGEAQQLWTEAESTFGDLAAESKASKNDSEYALYRSWQSTVWFDQYQSLQEQGADAKAIEILDNAIEEHTTMIDEAPDRPDLWRDKITLQTALASSLAKLDKHDRRDAVQKELVVDLSAYVAHSKFPDVWEYLYKRADAHFERSNSLLEIGGREEEISQYRDRSRADCDALIAAHVSIPNPPNAKWTDSVLPLRSRSYVLRYKVMNAQRETKDELIANLESAVADYNTLLSRSTDGSPKRAHHTRSLKDKNDYLRRRAEANVLLADHLTDSTRRNQCFHDAVADYSQIINSGDEGVLDPDVVEALGNRASANRSRAGFLQETGTSEDQHEADTCFKQVVLDYNELITHFKAGGQIRRVTDYREDRANTNFQWGVLLATLRRDSDAVVCMQNARKDFETLLQLEFASDERKEIWRTMLEHLK